MLLSNVLTKDLQGEVLKENHLVEVSISLLLIQDIGVSLFKNVTLISAVVHIGGTVQILIVHN